MSFFKKIFKRKKLGLTMAGGGCKAFFALGIGKVLIQEGIFLDAISGTSAGTAMALALVSNDPDHIVDDFTKLVDDNKANFYLSNFLKKEKTFPHEKIYRQCIINNMNYPDLLKSKTGLYFNALRLPKGLTFSSDKREILQITVKIINAYRLEFKSLKLGKFNPILRKTVQDLGIKNHIFTKDDLASPEHVENIILASSSAPPFIRPQAFHDGYYYLDGGIFDNFPINCLPNDLDCYLGIHYSPITRTFFELTTNKDLKKVMFIAPEKPLPVSSFDYTNPKGVRKAYEIGENTAYALLPEIKTFIKTS